MKNLSKGGSDAFVLDLRDEFGVGDSVDCQPVGD